jgi:hypothetical protein
MPAASRGLGLSRKTRPWGVPLANAAEWLTKGVGMWSFECRNHFPPHDLLDTAEKWRRCNVASHPPKSADTKAHLRLCGTPTQYSKDNENEFHGFL